MSGKDEDGEGNTGEGETHTLFVLEALVRGAHGLFGVGCLLFGDGEEEGGKEVGEGREWAETGERGTEEGSHGGERSSFKGEKDARKTRDRRPTRLCPAMFRLTPRLCQALKRSTGVTGLAVHPNPLPQLIKTYESTISALSSIPQTSVYRQGTEALTRHKLSVVQAVNGDIAAAERKLDEGQIEESLDIASDELELAQKMVEWKAYVTALTLAMHNPLTPVRFSWEDLQEAPEPGQWEYFGKTSSS
jgi:NADH dehydrogenase (ubiquinone) 1 alpha subcomplex subunit 5